MAGNRPNSVMSWDSDSVGSIADDMSLDAEYFEDDYADDWDSMKKKLLLNGVIKIFCLGPLKDEEVHQLYEDIDRLDPSRLTNFNQNEEEYKL